MSLPEGGRAVSGFIDALKNQPLSLALVVMNVGLLGFLYYSGIAAHHERQRELELLYQNRSEMAQLLYKCSPQEQH